MIFELPKNTNRVAVPMNGYSLFPIQQQYMPLELLKTYHSLHCNRARHVSSWIFVYHHEGRILIHNDSFFGRGYGLHVIL